MYLKVNQAAPDSSLKLESRGLSTETPALRPIHVALVITRTLHCGVLFIFPIRAFFISEYNVTYIFSAYE